jgi:fermentation-respiration switch protein FrsA (DUF1100 family)
MLIAKGLDHEQQVALYLQRRRNRKVSRFLLTLMIAYGLFCLAMMLSQRFLMYFPDRSAFNPSVWGLSDFKAMRLTTPDGLLLTSWYAPPRDSDKPTVVFMQGNAGHAGHRNYKVLPWVNAGYGVVMVGYRGFNNPGSPTEQGIYRDARTVLDELKGRGVTGQALVLYGESIGTGVAVQMATEFPAAGLILESPYTSTTDVGAWRYPFLPVRYLMWDRFESLAKISSVRMPLFVAHGEDDRTVPARFGKQLFEAANPPKQAMFVAGLTHKTIYDPSVQAGILAFIGNLPHDHIAGGVLSAKP